MGDLLLLDFPAPEVSNKSVLESNGIGVASLLDTENEAIFFHGPVSIGDFSQESVEALGENVSLLSFSHLDSLKQAAATRATRFCNIAMAEDDDFFGLEPLDGRVGLEKLPAASMDEAGYASGVQHAAVNDATGEHERSSLEIAARGHVLEQHRLQASNSEQVRGSGSSASASQVYKTAILDTVVGDVVVGKRLRFGEYAQTFVVSEDFANETTDGDYEFSRDTKKSRIERGEMPFPPGPGEGAAAQAPVVNLPMATAPATAMSDKALGKQPMRPQPPAQAPQQMAMDIDDDDGEHEATLAVYNSPVDFLEELRKIGLDTKDDIGDIISTDLPEMLQEMSSVPQELQPKPGDSEQIKARKQEELKRYQREVNEIIESYKMKMMLAVQQQQIQRTNTTLLIQEYTAVHGSLPPAEMFIVLIAQFPFLKADLELTYNYKFDEEAVKRFQKLDEDTQGEVAFSSIRQLKASISELESSIATLVLEGGTSPDSKTQAKLKLLRANMSTMVRTYSIAIEDLKSAKLRPGDKRTKAWKRLIQSDSAIDQALKQIKELDQLGDSMKVGIHFINDSGIGIKNEFLEGCNSKYRQWQQVNANASLQERYENEWQVLYAKYAAKERAINKEAVQIHDELLESERYVAGLKKQILEVKENIKADKKERADVRRSFESKCGDVDDSFGDFEERWEKTSIGARRVSISFQQFEPGRTEDIFEQLRVDELECDKLLARNKTLLDNINEYERNVKNLEWQIYQKTLSDRYLKEKAKNLRSKRKTGPITEEEQLRRVKRDKEQRELKEQKAAERYGDANPESMRKITIDLQNIGYIDALERTLEKAKTEIPKWLTEYANHKERVQMANKTLKQAGGQFQECIEEADMKKKKLDEAERSALEQRGWNTLTSVEKSTEQWQTLAELQVFEKEYKDAIQRLETEMQPGKAIAKRLVKMNSYVQKYRAAQRDFQSNRNEVNQNIMKVHAAEIKKIDQRFVDDNGLLNEQAWQDARQSSVERENRKQTLLANIDQKYKAYDDASTKHNEYIIALCNASKLAQNPNPGPSKATELTSEQKNNVDMVWKMLMDCTTTYARVKVDATAMKAMKTSEDKNVNGHKNFQGTVRTQLDNASKTGLLTREMFEEIFSLVWETPGLRVDKGNAENTRELVEKNMKLMADPEMADAVNKLAVERKESKRSVIKADDQGERSAYLQLKGFDEGEFRDAQRIGSVKEIVRCAEAGSGRALHFYQLVCSTLVEMFNTYPKVLITTEAPNCSQGPKGDTLMVSWASLPELESVAGGPELIKKLDYILTQWIRLPTERRCGSMPSLDELRRAKDLVSLGADQSKAVIDDITSELMTVTSLDKKINKGVFPGKGPTKATEKNLSEPMVKMKRTPVAWIEIVRDRIATHVPVDDELKVVRAEAGPQGAIVFPVHLTHTERLKKAEKYIGGPAVSKEVRAISSVSGAPKWPLNGANPNRTYADINMNDMNDASYKALLKAQEQLTAYQIQVVTIGDKLNQLDTQRRAIELVPTYAGFLDADDNPSVVNAEKINNLADIDKELVAFQTLKTTVDRRHFANRGMSGFGPLVTGVETALEAIRSEFVGSNTSQTLNIVRPDLGAASPIEDAADGLTNQSWKDDADVVIRFVESMNRFVREYYPWLPEVTPENRAMVDSYVNWMQTLRENGFPYFAVVTPNVPFSFVIPSNMTFSRLVLGPGPLGLEDAAFAPENTGEMKNRPLNFVYRKLSESADVPSDEEWYRSHRLEDATEPATFKQHVRKTGLELMFVEEAAKRAKGIDADAIEDAKATQARHDKAGASSFKQMSVTARLIEQSKTWRLHDAAFQLASNAGETPQANMYDPPIKLSWVESGVQVEFFDRLSKLKPDQFHGAIRALRDDPLTAGAYSVAVQYLDSENHHCTIVRTTTKPSDEFQAYDQITSNYEPSPLVTQWIAEQEARQQQELALAVNADVDMDDAPEDAGEPLATTDNSGGGDDDEAVDDEEDDEEDELVDGMEMGQCLQQVYEVLYLEDDMFGEFDEDLEAEEAAVQAVLELVEKHAVELVPAVGDLCLGTIREPVICGAVITPVALKVIS